MRKNKCPYFLPDRFSLSLLVFLFTFSLTLKASENSDYARFEKIFNNLEMETLANKKIKLSDLSSRTVIVNFWASWCIPCLKEMPSLIKLASKFPASELAVVMINTDEIEQLKNIDKTKKQLGFPDSFIIIPDKKFRIADEFKFSALPVTVVYKKGKVAYFENGPVDFLKAPADLW